MRVANAGDRSADSPTCSTDEGMRTVATMPVCSPAARLTVAPSRAASMDTTVKPIEESPTAPNSGGSANLRLSSSLLPSHLTGPICLPSVRVM